MKLWHLLFLLQSSFLFITLSVRVQDQFTFQMLQGAIPDPSSDTSSPRSQTENHILTNTDICNNLLEYLLVFGETATSKYKTCPEKYSLLGNSNSLVQKDQPQCLISLSQIFCTYEIVTDSVRPHPDDLRYFITQTISRCIRSQEWPSDISTYICPSLDYDTKIVKNKEEFCANLQAMHQYDSTMSQPDQDIFNSYYKTYQFVGKESIKECHEIVMLYNFCIEISLYLGLDTRKCFTNQFILYEEGGKLQEYNTKDQDTCKNFILPFFGYVTNQEDLLQPSNIFGFCDSINIKIIDQLQAKEMEIKQNLLNITTNKTSYEASVVVLTNLNTNPPQVTEAIEEIQTLWKRIYDYLTNYEQLEVTNVTTIEKENLDLFTNTVADWVMTSRSSLEFLKTLPIEETFLKNAELLTNNFDKIHLLGTHLTDYGKFLTDTFAKTVVPDNTEINMIENEDVINVNCSDLKATGELLNEAQTNLNNFLRLFDTRITNEIQTNQGTLDTNQNTINDLTERLQALQEQEKISFSHIPCRRREIFEG